MKQLHSTKPAWLKNVRIPILILLISVLVLFSASFALQTEKQVALFSALVIFVIGLTPRFRDKIRSQASIFFFLVTAYMIYAGLSTLYAYAPKLALSEYSRLLAAYAVFMTVFTFTSATTPLNATAVLSGSITVLSFIHLDAASWGIIGPKVMMLFQKLTGGYLPNEAGFDTYGYNIGTGRLYGLFGNANTMACMCALGLFLSIYLLVQAKGYKRIWPCIALVVNSVTFVLCISLGATAALGLSVLLVAILLHGAERRLTFLLITLQTLIVGGIVAVLSISHLGSPGSAGYLVWLFCILGVATLYCMDHVLRPRLIDMLCRRIKIFGIVALALVVILVSGSLILFSQSIPVTLTGTASLYKRFFPGTGTCEITLNVEGSAQLRISSFSQPEVLQEKSTLLLDIIYEDTVSLEIPDDAVDVQMVILPVDGSTVTINGIYYSGTEKSAEIAPGYRGIPQDILQRLQGLSTNHSAMQRLVFMEDGLKLWKQTPVFGRGLGGFENGITSVQSFFYETKYAHNHYIQLLADLGVVGLVLFVAMLIFGFKSIWPLRRKEDAAGLTPALLGVLLMFTIHGAIEFSPSVAEVSVFAFGSFGLIANVAPPLSINKKSNSGTVVWCTSLGIAALFGVYTILLILNAQASTNSAAGNATLEQIAKYAKTDVFEGDDYRLTYVINSLSTNDSEIIQQAVDFGEDLQEIHSNSIGPYLTDFYLQLGSVENAAAVSEHFLSYTKSVADNWNIQFQLFAAALQNNLDNTDMCNALVQLSLDTYNKLLEVNQQQMDDLPLTAANAAYITQLLSTEGDLLTRINTLFFDSSIAPDTNQDGCPDAITVRSGEVKWEDGQYTALTDSTLQLNLSPSRPGTYLLELTTENGEEIQLSLANYKTTLSSTINGISLQWDVPIEIINQPANVQIFLPQGSTIQQSTVKMIDGAFLT